MLQLGREWRLRIEHLRLVHADPKEPAQISQRPFGTRQILDVTDRHFAGPRLANGGTGFLVGGDGVGRLDVRATLRTDDEALIYVEYVGVLVFNEAVSFRFLSAPS
jgi:hypothetical protein